MTDTSLVFNILAKDKTGAELKRVKKSFDVLTAGIATAFAVKFAASSVKAYAEAERQQAALEGAYKRFPAVADLPINAMRELNSELQKSTIYDDDAVAGAQAVMAQFNLTGKQIADVTPLLLDYASATGQDVSSAATSLGKAFLGQTRALKAVGINYTSTGDSAQDFANITDLLRQKVGGFAENEGKTAAGQLAILQNQFGDLQESVGAALVPALQSLVDVAVPVLDTFNGLPQPVKNVALGVTALGAGFLLLAPRIKAARELMADWHVDMKRGVTTAGKYRGAITKVGGAIAGLAVAGAALRSFGDDQFNAGQSAETLQRKLQAFGRGEGSLDSLALGYELAGGSAADFNESLSNVADNHWWDQLGTAVAGVAGVTTTFDAAKQAVDTVDQALADMVRGGDLKGAEDAFQRLRTEFVKGGGSAEDFDKAMGDYADALGNAKPPTDDLTGAVNKQIKKVRTLDTAWKIFDGTLSHQEAKDAAKQAVDDLAASLKENGKAFDGTSKKGLANRDALREAMRAVQAHVDSLKTGPAKAKAYQDGLDRLKGQLEKSGLTPAQRNALLQPLIDVGKEIDAVKTKGNATVTLKIQPKIVGSGIVEVHATGGGRALIDYRADGGPVAAGKPYVVGERGPEIFQPKQSGTIIPNHKIGAGGVNFYGDINVQSAPGETVDQSLPRALRRTAFELGMGVA